MNPVPPYQMVLFGDKAFLPQTHAENAFNSTCYFFHKQKADLTRLLNSTVEPHEIKALVSQRRMMASTVYQGLTSLALAIANTYSYSRIVKAREIIEERFDQYQAIPVLNKNPSKFDYEPYNVDLIRQTIDGMRANEVVAKGHLQKLGVFVLQKESLEGLYNCFVKHDEIHEELGKFDYLNQWRSCKDGMKFTREDNFNMWARFEIRTDRVQHTTMDQILKLFSQEYAHGDIYNTDNLDRIYTRFQIADGIQLRMENDSLVDKSPVRNLFKSADYRLQNALTPIRVDITAHQTRFANTLTNMFERLCQQYDHQILEIDGKQVIIFCPDKLLAHGETHLLS